MTAEDPRGPQPRARSDGEPEPTTSASTGAFTVAGPRTRGPDAAVPRETPRVGAPAGKSVPPSSEVLDHAAALLGDRLDLMERYATLLADVGVPRGLVGPREIPRLWERHILNCAAVAPLFPGGTEVVDVGSGAGLPGLVLAIARPDLHLVLSEPLLRRSSFLTDAVITLGLSNVKVQRIRAEDMTGSFDAVTARAVAPLERLARWTLPLLRPGGQLVALKGESAGRELQASVPVLEGLGARGWRVRELDAGPGIVPTRVVVVEGGRPVRQGGSRRPGTARRRRRS